MRQYTLYIVAYLLGGKYGAYQQNRLCAQKPRLIYHIGVNGEILADTGYFGLDTLPSN